MDWIKVKTKHVLLEYQDLTDSQFRAWIKVMALTAELGHMPTEKQILQHMHSKTLKSLQNRFKTSLKSIENVLEKVLEDVHRDEKKRVGSRDRAHRYRLKNRGSDKNSNALHNANETGDVTQTKRERNANGVTQAKKRKDLFLPQHPLYLFQRKKQQPPYSPP